MKRNGNLFEKKYPQYADNYFNGFMDILKELDIKPIKVHPSVCREAHNNSDFTHIDLFFNDNNGSTLSKLKSIKHNGFAVFNIKVGYRNNGFYGIEIEIPKELPRNYIGANTINQARYFIKECHKHGYKRTKVNKVLQ